MRTTPPLLAIALLASACGSMQPTAGTVRDDVYDIPDRTPVTVAATPQGQPAEDDYFNPADSGKYDLARFEDRTYNDITYNDPSWYNYGRFGFGVGVSSWGPSYGMGMSYGYPGNYGYGDPFYNPYWSNSWMSGYGAWGSPYYSGWNMYGSMNWGYPYGGYNPYGGFYGGYSPYGGLYPFGPPCCMSCGGYYGGYSGSNVVVQHRPSWSGSGGTAGTPPPYRPNSLLSPRPSAAPTVRSGSGTVQGGSRNGGSPQRVEGSRSGGGGRITVPSMGGSRGSGGSQSGGGSFGGGGGGGSRPSTGGRR